jgi:hypothetical protein
MRSPIQLPLIQDQTTLPTKRHYVSFSEISDWSECSFRHKLKYVKKIKLEDTNIHSAFGRTVHDTVETFLKTRQMPEGAGAIKDFYKNLATIPDADQLTKAFKDAPDFARELPDMVGQLPQWIDETFPGWKIVSCEHDLFEPIEKQTNIRFKGFIDAIIRIPKEPTKKLIKECEKQGIPVPTKWEYWIIDWKTCSWGWPAERKRDFMKQMQIILYKHFFCKFMGLDIKDVKCGFVLMKRVPPKDRVTGDRIELVPISVGPKAVERALKVLHNMINQVRKGFAFKNRRSCLPFCPYKGTLHCP